MYRIYQCTNVPIYQFINVSMYQRQREEKREREENEKKPLKNSPHTKEMGRQNKNQKWPLLGDGLHLLVTQSV